MTIYGEVWWRCSKADDPYRGYQVAAPFESMQRRGAISAICQTVPKVFPIAGEPISLIKGDELFSRGCSCILRSELHGSRH